MQVNALSSCPCFVRFWGSTEAEVRLFCFPFAGGWLSQTSSDFSLAMLPGDHFFIQTYQAPLLELIARDLAKH